MVIKSYVDTKQGAREYQQDACLLKHFTDKKKTIAVICDGMGGMEDGHIASQYVVNHFLEEMSLFDFSDSFQENVRNLIVKIDQEVHDMNPNTGTTLVSVIVEENCLSWVSVGDSKLYIIRGEEMVCATKEHTFLSWLNEQISEMRITEEDYEDKLPMGSALISYIGMGNISLIDMNQNPFRLKSGDIILLCSDGLYKAVGENTIHSVINREKDPQKVMDILQDMAMVNAGNRQDNTSIILLYCE